jgi:hypothetical protein
MGIKVFGEKMKFKKIIIFFHIIFMMSCADKKKDNNLALGILLYLANNQSTDVNALLSKLTDINTPVGKASAVSNMVSSVAGSAASAGNVNPRSGNLQLNNILNNGLDPYIVDSSLRLQKSNTRSSSMNTKSITYTESGTDANGNRKYSFSGTKVGYDLTNEKRTIKINVQDALCKEFTIPDYNCFSNGTNSSGVACTQQGNQTISNGEHTFSNFTSTAEYTFNSKADLNFTDFGTGYFDPLMYTILIKKAIDKGFFSKCNKNKFTSSNGNQVNDISGDGCTCDLVTSIYGDVYEKGFLASKISGDLSYNFTSNIIPISSSSITNADGTSTNKSQNKGKNSSISSSSNGLTIVQNGTNSGNFTFSNLKFSSEYSMNSESTTKSENNQTVTYSFKYSGNYLINISGVVKGETINETFNIIF